MAFERIALQLGKPKASAGITITKNGKTVIALRKDLVAKVGFKSSDTFSVLLGSDEDHGKLRIVKDKAGIACARELSKTGAFFLNLGMVPAIATTPAKQRPIEARVIENGIEIDIPPDEGPKLLAPPAQRGNSSVIATEAAAPAPAKNKPATNGVDLQHFNGITIDFAKDAESVAFKGESIEVTARQAEFVKLLARPRPQPVAESFLVAGIWNGKPSATAKEQLKTMAADLQKGLSPIGLNLCLVKGVGYQLKDL